MGLPVYEVDVPIRNTVGRSGVHAFAGSRDAALRIAHKEKKLTALLDTR